MSAREPRKLLPWERDIGCPSCGSAAGIRCVTMDTLYPPWWKFRDIDTLIGSPTTAHKARVDNWIRKAQHESSRGM